MKKYWKLLLCAALTVGAFTACEDVPEPYNIPTDQGGETPIEVEPSGSGTLDDPFNVAACLALVREMEADVESDQAYYIKGKVAANSTSDATISQYGNMTFTMYDEGNPTSTFTAFQVYGPGNKRFTSVDQIKVGDEVIVYGKVVNYRGNTPETVGKGQAYVYSINSSGGETPAEGIEVTCAEAVELTKALADGGTSAETYTITGYITEVVGNVSRDQQTFWMADTKDGGRVFEAYWANLPEGVSEFKVGSKVKITGQLMKYVNTNTGQVTPEIKNPTVEILEEGGEETPAEGIAVTCAEAVTLTNALADGATSTETYTVTGYITEVVGNVSRDQQTFWMADTKDGGRVFEAYWANLPEGVSAFKKGSKVKITGQLMKYVKDGNVTPEIKNATVIILEEGGGDTPAPTGTEVTCAQAVELTNALADGATSSETYTVSGYITEVIGNVSRDQQSFWMADTQDGGRVFEAYWANLPEGVSAFKVGMKVKITGQLMKFVKDGNVTPEIKNADVQILEGGEGGGGDTPGGSSLADFTNGDFETWEGNQPIGWKSVSTASNATLSQSTDAHGGSYSVIVKGSTSGNKRLAYKELELEAGTYDCAFWTKAATSSAASLCPGYAAVGSSITYNYDKGEDGKNKYVNDIDQDWQQVKYSFTLSSKTTVCLVVMNSKTTGTDLLIDDFTITKK
ncbi:MAG: hypothetical protein IJK15_10490 [Bacteroidaceae bacterium]|nr:hypothetical protein [Bacteroidaceae bacterium]